jgi:hypothetical protein
MAFRRVQGWRAAHEPGAEVPRPPQYARAVAKPDVSISAD